MRSLIDVAKANTNKVHKNTDANLVNGQENVGLGGVGRSKKHESAEKHVAGEAIYVDDRPSLRGELHAAVGQSTHAHANILSIDLSAVKKAEGVVAVITVDDVPGHTDIGPIFPGDPVLAIGKVEFVGQPIFAVAATSYDLARKAVKLAKIEYQALEAVLTVKDALAKQNFVRPPFTMKRGDSDVAIADAEHQLSGEIVVGGQEHMYLEGQVSTAVPTEDGGMEIFTSSQHPSEVQKLVAEVLAIPLNKVLVDMRRMGGGFGGKETQAAPWACIAALLANETKRPVKFKLGRMDDMIMTGKRHPFENNYRVGFDNNGQIKGINIEVNGNCGYSPDLSDAIVDRAMFHSDNAYFLDQATVTGNRCKLNTVSHTAYRGFGGPQGMMTIEMVMDDIARHLGKDPLEIRKVNLYGDIERNMTHYHQKVEHNNLSEIIETLEASSDYQLRRQAITAFNANSPILKKGIALTPVKFGISFTVQHLNQAGALVHIYTDGTIHLNHGGSEMGQGLNTKVAQIVAEEFKVNVDTVAVSSARTDKVPNTSPTAASSGTDLNGKAAEAAAKIIKQRLIDFACEKYQVTASQVIFENNNIVVGEQTFSFAEFCQIAYMGRVSLSSTGFYKTPKIHFDRATGKGRPFFYYATGAAVSEVIIDTLTGEYKTLRTDILQDVGHSINPAIDIGQIEGAFIQGMGWLTTEELMWNEQGRLLSNNPATYKIPAINDTPQDFRVTLMPDAPNREHTIYNSKAVGEPPFMLGMSVWCALKDAISSIADYKISPELDTPATPERVLWAVEAVKSQSSAIA
ncbi:xanthine dehydrogenase molybdopterin binding subunit [Colwellia sp. 1_MG-2023]|uniref:xanthine dehydrogenase molybdopterin binding subunit n=1 Tax=unclassified Colwellia TaxID=196834 RepID=UPI001C093823|nr:MULTISPECIES: xanthine dehydrogenase molybdopterin binding subunit [unclassified Colwellia]MBU2923882.1 xanthine dehydrogenase molybdopterin binding subunit [Colwellia sp. C2M11]MDO6653046.1 xanthine dehydrogenase molybdopterin binding subunit [Colwellia sp. 3_MG-2023]MDO6665967.1 xanthine dehydrogenase molybdopterin binding subunit [Colwellia sp. 2_MG-2023]MDO6690340.1 xanthine dehydrogenase molybdopterin binding subunit [Colwellia sp. 1_MG-2023]